MCQQYLCLYGLAGIILGMGWTKERRRYNVTPSLVGPAHTQNDPWVWNISLVYPTVLIFGQQNWRYRSFALSQQYVYWEKLKFLWVLKILLSILTLARIKPIKISPSAYLTEDISIIFPYNSHLHLLVSLLWVHTTAHTILTVIFLCLQATMWGGCGCPVAAPSAAMLLPGRRHTPPHNTPPHPTPQRTHWALAMNTHKGTWGGYVSNETQIRNTHSERTIRLKLLIIHWIYQ